MSAETTGAPGEARAPTRSVDREHRGPLERPRRVVILGGGLAGLTAAYELTRTAEQRQSFEVTVYQMGFRLGGKLASSRTQTASTATRSTVSTSGVASMRTPSAWRGKCTIAGSALRAAPFRRLDGQGARLVQGSPFGLLSSAIHRIAGICGGESLRVRQRKLRSRIALHLPEADVSRVVTFVGQMVGIPFTESADVPLRAALQDARLMGAQIRRAFEDWLSAECAARPVVLVLEDLGWGDRPSVDLLTAALRHLRDSPLLVLCTGDPEVRGMYPELFSERGSREILVSALSRETCERIAREALEPLGQAGSPEQVARIVEAARGNPLHLEELIRSVAEQPDADLPDAPRAAFEETVASLSVEAQRVLRAASVFGDTFTEGGLHAILKDTIIEAELSGMFACRHWLSALVEREVVVRRGGRSITDAEEFVFRHDILREVAYEALPDQERAIFHRRAGEWLERMALGEPGALARHFEIGGEHARAAGWCALAAERSLEGDDFAGIGSFMERGIALGASGQLLGTLRLLGSEAYKWRGEHAHALAFALEAMSELPAGSAHWYSAAGQAALVSGNIGDHERLVHVFNEIRAVESNPPSAPHVIALSRVALQLLQAGFHELSDEAFAELETVEDDVIHRDPEVAASLYRARLPGALRRRPGDEPRLLHVGGAGLRGGGGPAQRLRPAGQRGLREHRARRLRRGRAGAARGAHPRRAARPHRAHGVRQAQPRPGAGAPWPGPRGAPRRDSGARDVQEAGRSAARGRLARLPVAHPGHRRGPR